MTAQWPFFRTIIDDVEMVLAKADMEIAGRYVALVDTAHQHFFDINDPDRETAQHADTGEVADVVPLSDFMSFSEVNGHDVTLVLPTRHYLSEQTDDNGNRFSDVGEDDLRDFIRDVVSGQYGDPTIRTLEIGNEYWC